MTVRHLPEDLRAVAYDWHGGQRSALYGLASTGRYDTDKTHAWDKYDLLREIDTELRPTPQWWEPPAAERHRLRALREWVAWL